VAEQLFPEDIEYIHDVLVSTLFPPAWGGRVNPTDYKNQELLSSAAARPFQTFGGQELIPSLDQKAAALFHSLVCNHCFHDGNKRTAVVALDIFLTINNKMLVMSQDDVYELAIKTAEANSLGKRPEEVLEDLTMVIASKSADFSIMRQEEFLATLTPGQEATIRRLVAVHDTRVQNILSRLDRVSRRRQPLG
jgi:death-on-curing family protein